MDYDKILSGMLANDDAKDLLITCLKFVVKNVGENEFKEEFEKTKQEREDLKTAEEVMNKLTEDNIKTRKDNDYWSKKYGQWEIGVQPLSPAIFVGDKNLGQYNIGDIVYDNKTHSAYVYNPSSGSNSFKKIYNDEDNLF